MNQWQRVLTIGLLGSFPMAAYLLGTAPKAPEQAEQLSQAPKPTVTREVTEAKTSDVALRELNTAIENKAREIQKIDVKILENKGSILRLEEEKKTVIKDLEAFHVRLTSILRDLKKEETFQR